MDMQAQDILVDISECIKAKTIEKAIVLITYHEAKMADSSDFWNLKGVAYYTIGDLFLAHSSFQQSISINPTNVDAIENLEKVKRDLESDNRISSLILTNLQSLEKEEYLRKVVGVLDHIKLEVRLCIQFSKSDKRDCLLSLLKNVHKVMSYYHHKEIERLKSLVPSRFLENVFENILLCIDDCFIDYDQNSGNRLTLLIEFILFSLIKELREEIYFFGLVYPDSKKMEPYYKNEFARANANEYAKSALDTGKYKYPLSFVVTAFNKLEYTKMCVESIMQYAAEFEYEIILVNDGSSDGTKEYYEGLKIENKKVINLHKNTGAMIAYFIGMRAVEGEYLAAISNDVIITEHWLRNLLICIKSDPQIAMVVPTANNISNNQSIEVTYETIEEMQRFAKNYNVSNSQKWQERDRLCHFSVIFRMEVFGRGLCHDRLYQYGEFCDDDISLLLRKNGYKLILAKDTFCHHFGSISLGDAQRKDNTLIKSRDIFIGKNKIDPWLVFTNGVMGIPSIPFENRKKDVEVLCIDPGLGSVPYAISNLYKSKELCNVTIRNFSCDLSLSPISSLILKLFTFGESLNSVSTFYDKNQFDYIVFCKPIEEYAFLESSFRNLKTILKNNGEIRFVLSNVYSAKNILSLLTISKNCFKNDGFINFLSMEFLDQLLINEGYRNIQKTGIMKCESVDVDIVKKLSNQLGIQASNERDRYISSQVLFYSVSI